VMALIILSISSGMAPIIPRSIFLILITSNSLKGALVESVLKKSVKRNYLFDFYLFKSPLGDLGV